MKLKDVQKTRKKDVRRIVSIKVTEEDYKWIKDNNVNLGLLVQKVIDELRGKK